LQEFRKAQSHAATPELLQLLNFFFCVPRFQALAETWGT
jgi:hypothetical protein